jgi:hypothetical protein
VTNSKPTAVRLPLHDAILEGKLPAISLGPFQERLLEGATLLEKRQVEARQGEPARELRLWRTGFKYPLVREEVWLGADDQKRLQPVRREFSVADHALVKFPADVTEKQITDWAKKHGFEMRHQLHTAPVRLVAVANGSLDSADVIMAAFRKAFPKAAAQSAVAERDYLVFPSLLPDDTSFAQLWGLNNTGQTGGTADADIDAPEAWEISTGSREVLVGVIDTGVDRTHPDLAANMWRNPNEVANNGLDDDQNGFVDDANGWDFYANDNNPTDENNHGTHCSGTIGGVGNNLAGVTGVCWQVSLVGIRFLGPQGGTTSDAIESVNYATNLGVDLTSNSWGGGGFSALLQTAIEGAGAADQLFIAAAGNDGSNTDLSVNYPSGYLVDNIVSVASSTDRDARSSFSNYGANSVDLAAPGSAIYSTIIGGSYASFSGTSMATPHVAGAVALLKSLDPAMTALEIKAQLLSTVDALPAFAGTTLSGGRLNLLRLTEQLAGPRPLISVTTIEEQPGGNGDGIYNPGEALALRFTVVNRGHDPAQNIVASLASSSANSRFSIIQGTVNVGTLGAGQTVSPAAAFVVQSQADTPTPYAEEFIITQRYGTPQEESTHRVTLYLHTSSRVRGRITDVGTGAALSGATIRLVGPTIVTATSGADGTYQATLINGIYNVNATASGYVPSVPVSVTVPPNRDGVDFALGVPQLALTPSEVDADVYSNRPLTRTVEMRNRGTAPLQWSLQSLNGLPADAAAERRTYRLPSSVVVENPQQDGGPRQAFKSMQMQEVQALVAPLGSLDGMTIGAISEGWDRSVLIGDLQSRGATVVTLTLPLSVSALDAVNAIIVDDSIASFTSTDMGRLRTRVSAGAGVLCEADNSDSITKINQLFASTGITAFYDGFQDLSFTDIRPHTTTVGVTRLQEVAVGASAVVSGEAKTLVGTANGRSHAAYSFLGSGVLVFVGNEITDESNFVTGDARRFANQIVDELVDRPRWLSVTPTTGILQAGAVQTLTLGLNPANLSAGSYEATILFRTNIPDTPELTLPVTMDVVDAPLLSLNQNSVAFGSVVEGVAIVRHLILKNDGVLPLQVSALRFQGQDAASFSVSGSTAFQIAPGASRQVTLSFATTALVRDHVAQLVIESDDPTTPSVSVAVTGTRQLAPDIVLSPPGVLLTLNQGQTGSANVVIENKGKGPLDWQAALGHQPGAVGSSPTWAALPGVSGRYLPSVRGALRINFDTGLLPPGDHTTTLYVLSQDPETPLLTMPVTLRVKGVPRAQFIPAVNFANTIVGTRRQVSVAIQNIGGANLVLNSKLSLSPSFVCLTPMPLTLAAGETRTLIMEFRPTRAGSVTGSVLLGANLPSRFIFFTLNARGVRGPTIQVNPSQITINTAPGVVLPRGLTVSNLGDLSLTWVPTVEGQVTWLKLIGAGSTLAGTRSVIQDLSIETRHLSAGTHTANIVYTSNDAARPRLVVPVRINVSSSAALSLTPSSLSFPDAWTGRNESSFFHIENTGNAPLQILSISASNARLNPQITLPVTLEAGYSTSVPFLFTPTDAGDYDDAFIIKSSLKTPKEFRLPVRSKVVTPPTISVTPGSLDEEVAPGQLVTRNFTVANGGGAALKWTSSVRNVTGPAGSLTEVLQNFNANAGTITSFITSPFAMTEGITGSKISDGGGNMFDDGNVHATDLNGEVAVPYSDNVIATHASVGASGSYFTRKSGPLFVFAAELADATRFAIRGGLGADGAGSVSTSTFTRVVAGVTYRGFLKRVSGAAMPSVNHLIIVEDKAGLAQNAATSTDSDGFEITGLSGRTRIFHLLFGSANGLFVADVGAIALMDVFLQKAVHPTALTWLTQAVSQGTAPANGTAIHAIQLDARTLPGGTYGATLRFSSNALSLSQVDVPVTLRVPSQSKLVVEPSPLNFPDTYAQVASTFSLTLSNPGNIPLTIQRISASDPAFTLSGLTLPVTLAPRGSVAASLRFLPTELRDYTASLTFESNATGMPETVIPVTGRGVRGPAISVTPTPIALTVDPGSSTSQVLTITNDGTAALTWTAARSISLASLASLSASSGTTPVGGSRQFTLNVTAAATAAPGTVTGSVTLTSNDPARPTLTVPVSITVNSRPRLGFSPASLVAFGDVFMNGSSQIQVQLRNLGNVPLNISSISSSDAHFDLLPVTLPITIATNGSKSVTVRFSPDNSTAFSGELRFSTNDAIEPVSTLALTGRGVLPPTISVQPGSITATLEKGRVSTQPLSIANAGGTTLTWQASIVNSSTPVGTLQDVLQRFNNRQSQLTALIPNIYSFTEGETGTYISDGSNDMYDSGNFLSTDLGANLAYSNNAVITSTALGAGGSYFTRKYDGLFVFTGDMKNVSSFQISGGLGADGSGFATGAVLTRTVGGITYKGFFKAVYGTSDPSVNHLIVVQDKPGVSHTYSANTDSDDHSVTGLSGDTRLYYLLFATQNGGQVSQTQVGLLMDAFLQEIALPTGTPWVSMNPSSGNTVANGTSAPNLQLNTQSLPVGAHTATVRFTSNAPASATLDLPVSLTVIPTTLSVAPAALEALQLKGATAQQSTLTLTAVDGANPAWTAASTVPWISLSKTTGTGSDVLTLTYSNTLAGGSYQGEVMVNFNGITDTVPVTLTVREAAYTQLLTDYSRPRLYGVIRGTGGQPSILSAVNAATLSVEDLLLLPTDISDADVTTDGKLLYAISYAGRSITEVDLESFTLLSTKQIPPPMDVGSGAPYHYDIEAGRPGIVYYTDATSQPRLHVFDFNAGIDLSNFVLNSGAGIGDFVVTPDGGTIYAWSQSGWTSSGTSILARINSASNTLSQSSLGTDTVTQDPLQAPVFFSAGRDAVTTKNSRYNAGLTTRQTFTGRNFIASSAYGHALVSGSEVLNGTDGTVRRFLPVTVSVAAFTGDQTALVYLNSATQQLARTAIPNLPAASITPVIADGTTLSAVPTGLSWTGSPLSASYDVFLGSDAAAVGAATNMLGGIYRGNTTAVSFSIGSSSFQLGQTYYWRIDTRNFDGSTVKGQVWSFRLPVVAVAPGSVSMASMLGSTTALTTTLNITAASPATNWSLSTNAAWVSLSHHSGAGAQAVTVTLSPGQLPAGTNQAQLTLSSGADTLIVPVTFRILGSLNIIKMEADPTLSRVYALHRDLSSPYEGWLLWIDPVTASVEQAVLTSDDATDFAVHALDDRLYALTNGGTRVVAVQRQQARQITGSWNLSTPAVAIHNGPLGRLVARSAANVIQMHNSVSGGLVGSSITLPASITRTPSAGDFLYAAVQQNPSVTGIVRYALSSSGITQNASLYWSGTLGPLFVVSGNGERAFFNQKAYALSSTISELGDLATPIQASSWSGQMAFSGNKNFFVSGVPLELSVRSFATSFMTATANNSRLVLYHPTNRILSSVDPGALVASPSVLGLGQVKVGTTGTALVNVTNLSSQDVTLTVTANHASLSGPAIPVTVNAGQFAQVPIRCSPTVVGSIAGNVTFSVSAQPQLSRTIQATAQSVTEISSYIVDFSTGTPADGTTSSSSTYSEDGLLLSTPSGLLRVGANTVNRPNNGTPHVATFSTQTPMAIRRGDGGVFHLLSVDLAEYSYVQNVPKTITFTGVKSGGGNVTTSFTLDGSIDSTGPLADFQTFTFPASFRDLVSAGVSDVVYAMDNLVFDKPIGPASVTASASHIIDLPSALDLNADGRADLWIIGEGTNTQSGRLTTHTFSYTRQSGVSDSAVVLQGSRDGQSWSSLTPGLDYTVESVTQDLENHRETVRLSIPTASAIEWRFRLISAP